MNCRNGCKAVELCTKNDLLILCIYVVQIKYYNLPSMLYKKKLLITKRVLANISIFDICAVDLKGNYYVPL